MVKQWVNDEWHGSPIIHTCYKSSRQEATLKTPWDGYRKWLEPILIGESSDQLMTCPPLNSVTPLCNVCLTKTLDGNSATWWVLDRSVSMLWKICWIVRRHCFSVLTIDHDIPLFDHPESLLQSSLFIMNNYYPLSIMKHDKPLLIIMNYEQPVMVCKSNHHDQY